MFRSTCILYAASLALVAPVLADDTNAASATPAPAAAAPAMATPPKAAAADTNSPDAAAAAPAAGDTGTTPSEPVGPTKPYTVKKGDSPWKIAHRLSKGHTKEFEDKILAANPGLDPKKLHAGQVIQLPAN